VRTHTKSTSLTPTPVPPQPTAARLMWPDTNTRVASTNWRETDKLLNPHLQRCSSTHYTSEHLVRRHCASLTPANMWRQPTGARLSSCWIRIWSAALEGCSPIHDTSEQLVRRHCACMTPANVASTDRRKTDKLLNPHLERCSPIQLVRRHCAGLTPVASTDWRKTERTAEGF